MKINEKTISEIKHCAECAACNMVNHKRRYFPDNGSFDTIINRMHTADNKDDLGKAYYDYIVNAIDCGYSDGYIIGGIMQNEDKNKEFNVNIDSVIEQLIKIKSGEEQASVDKPQNEDKTDDKQTPVDKPQNSDEPNTSEKTNNKSNNITEGIDGFNKKRINKIKKKIEYMNGLLRNLLSNQSKNPADDINKIKSNCNYVKQKISSIDLTTCSVEDIAEINNASLTIDGMLTSVDAIGRYNLNLPNVNVPVTNAPVAFQQQPAVAHTLGFNVNNFIEPPAINIAKNNLPVPAIPATPKQLPHESCGLTDDEIVAEVEKHIIVKDKLMAKPLYDLIKNKTLSKKMKELNSKQRPNNPFLTQVDINEYIDIPELLERYSLCFTMPCNDKGQVIVVLYNPVAEKDKNGTWNYPLHIFKAHYKKK